MFLKFLFFYDFFFLVFVFEFIFINIVKKHYYKYILCIYFVLILIFPSVDVDINAMNHHTPHLKGFLRFYIFFCQFLFLVFFFKFITSSCTQKYRGSFLFSKQHLTRDLLKSNKIKFLISMCGNFPQMLFIQKIQIFFLKKSSHRVIIVAITSRIRDVFTITFVLKTLALISIVFVKKKN